MVLIDIYSSTILQEALIVFFLGGVAYLLFSFRRTERRVFIARLSLVLFFLFPVFLFCAAGLMGINFGWLRNFIYLLPVYFLMFFYCLRNMLLARKYYYIASAFLLAWLFISSIRGSMLWSAVNAERETMRCASEVKSDTVWIPYPLKETDSRKWPFLYYARKFALKYKAAYICATRGGKRYLCFFKGRSKDKLLAVIETLPGNAPPIKERYILGGKAYTIVRTREYGKVSGPFQFIKDFFGMDSPRIFVYYCKRAPAVGD